MSPVVDIQRRMRELGRIRMGEKRTSKNGKEYPAALGTFRFTSLSQGILARMAEQVGGEVGVWEDAPGDAQFQLYSTASEIQVVVPPMDEPFSQWMEHWTGGGCQRRCDGEVAMVAQENGMRERPCVCKANGQEGEDRECKLTTRASFILPWAPGIGVWRLESHGYNAAVELGGTLLYLARQAAQGVYLECRLRLERREKRIPGQETRNFVVPVLDTDMTPQELLAGTASMPSLEPGPHGRPALPSGSAELPAQAGMQDPERAPSGSPGWGSTPKPPSGEDARRGAPESEPEPEVISEGQRRRVFALGKEHGFTSREQVKRVVKEVTGHDSTTKITRDQYEAVCSRIEQGPPPENTPAEREQTGTPEPNTPPAAGETSQQTLTDDLVKAARRVADPDRGDG